MFDKDRIFLYHPQKELIGTESDNKVIVELTGEMEKGILPEPDTVEYKRNGVEYYAGYTVIADGEYILLVSAERAEIFSVLSNMVRFCIISMVVAIIICILIGAMLARMVATPIKRVTEVIQSIAKLDFTEERYHDELKKRKDETGIMGRAIFELRDILRDIVLRLRDDSNLLLNSSQQLDKSSSEIATTLEQVDQAVQDIASGATSQANETQVATENVVLIGTMVEKARDEIGDLHKEMLRMKENGAQAQGKLEVVLDANEKTKESIGLIQTQTTTTYESAVKIKDIVALITSIAERTTLLSLNASIEAARAGEQGKGFAVVAAEIQKLAVQSDESVQKIEDIVNYLITDSEEAVQIMENVTSVVGTQIKDIEEIGGLFVHVQDGINGSMDGIREILEHTSQLAKARYSVVDVVQNLTAIAEENAASTEETAASVTEVGSIMIDVASNAEKLRSLADTLDESLHKFTI